MALRAPVFAGNITNLSDARYFSGVGVQWLGFQVDSTQAAFLSPQQFKEIAGWVAGPELVLEPELNKSDGQLIEMAKEYGLDLFRLPPRHIYSGPFGWYINSPDLKIPSLSAAFMIIEPSSSQSEEAYFKIIESQLPSLPIFIRVQSTVSADRLMKKFPEIGFYVRGSQELRPGIAEYDERELMEYLDVD